MEEGSRFAIAGAACINFALTKDSSRAVPSFSPPCHTMFIMVGLAVSRVEGDELSGDLYHGDKLQLAVGESDVSWEGQPENP